MKRRSDHPDNWDVLRAKIIGLGEQSIQKSYYPELQRRLEDLNRFRVLLDQSIEGIVLARVPTGALTDVNESICDQLGYSKSELLRMTFTDLVLPHESQLISKFLSRQSVPEQDAPIETSLRKRNGDSIPVEMTIRLVELGGSVHAVAVMRDITSRKQAEKEILNERSKLKTLSDNAPFGMVLIDKEGYYTYINKKFTELFGYDLSDIPDGRTWFRKAYPETEYRHAVIATWKEDWGMAKPGTSTPRVFSIICKDRTKKVVNFITSALVSGDYLTACEDITEMRKLESQLHQARKTEAIGTLAGGIAHDFNNILTALMGYAALTQMNMDTSDPLRSYVDQILIASQKAVDLTQSLLAFSRQQSVTLMPLNMNNTIKAAEKLLRRLLTEDIEFRTSLTDNDMIVMADKSQMDQILFNLATNARDAMPKGGTLSIETDIVTMNDIFVKVHGFGEAGKYVLINVSDTGMGMDETTKEKIFDPFFTTKAVGKGTGLGLATVYGIVKQHDGYITVESTLNQGTTFHIYLPAIKMEIDETVKTTIPIKRGKETILIAEDNEGVRHFMRDALQGYGYIIREAIDGEDAVEKFKQHRDIDLLVIDSVMPKKNGREVYEEIHGIDPHTKALFTSGYTKDIILDKGIEEKDVDFIAKPVSLNKLLQKVREVLDR